MESDASNKQSRTMIGCSPEEVSQLMGELGEPSYRGKQVTEWLYQKRVADPELMTNLSKPLREKLKAEFVWRSSQVRASESGDNTSKVALAYPDGNIVEAVLIQELAYQGSPERRTACVSLQAGCAMGCRFCASGQLGLSRNLSVAEVLEQFYAIGDLMKPEEKLTHVVFMGMGEPLHNWDTLVGILRVLTADWGFAMSPRRLTVSTVGLPGRIRELAELDIAVHLAISLHAPNDEVREKLIPTNKAFGGVDNILNAATYYFDQTKRQVTFEYTLVHGVNDRIEHAQELARRVYSRLPTANINLIPMNPVEGSGLKTPEMDQVRRFSDEVQKTGLSVHTRKRKGRAIQAACGQLRLKQLQSE